MVAAVSVGRRAGVDECALIDLLCLPTLVTERWFGRDGEETRYALLRELAALPLRTDRTRTYAHDERRSRPQG